MAISLLRRQLGCGGPLQHFLLRDQRAPERRCDSMNANRCFKRKIGDRQKPAAGLINQLGKKSPNGAAPAPLRESRDEVGEYLSAMGKYREQRPEPGIAGQEHPPHDQHQHQRWRNKATTQIVDDHPFAECREIVASFCSVCFADAPAQPGQ